LLDRPESILALPGAGVLQHLQFPAGTQVTVVRDGDKPGSPADTAVITGPDALHIQKVDVNLTPTKFDEDQGKDDANSILQCDGKEALNDLIDNAYPHELSKPWRIIKYLATLDFAQYEQERTKRAKEIGWRVQVLDDAVADLRDAKTFHTEDS